MKSKPVFVWLRLALSGAIIMAIPLLGAGCTYNYDAYSNPIRHDYDYNDVEGYDSQTSGSPWYGQSRYGEGYEGAGYGGGGYGGW